MKHVFLYGDGWGAIAAYRGLIKSSLLSVTVVTNDSKLKQIAENYEDVNLLGLKNEIIIFDSYKSFVPLTVLENNTCINIHHSLLPSYRGLHSTVWAILNDEPMLGFSVHLMNEFMDDGDIIYQKKFKNDFLSTSKQYMEMCNEYKSMHLGSIIEDYLNGILVPYKQDKSKASWVGRRGLDDCKIDFSRPIKYQKAFFRALVEPYPMPYFIYNSLECIVKKVAFHHSSVETHIGRILNIDNDGLWVKIEDGYMVIKEIENREGDSVPFTLFKIGHFLNKC